jgi:glycosyltransferase involved in cell wall biosynthesis
MKICVSIIVPVYNVEQYLSQCIESILMQTFTNFECILIDDCSEDKSLIICNEYAEKDNRIKVIHNEKNIGASLTRKKGLLAANGDYIQYIDSDDWIEKDMIDVMYTKAVSDNCDMVICDCYYNKDNSEIKLKQDCSSLEKINIIKNVISMKIYAYLFNKIVKREVLLTAEFPEYNRAEDYFITIQNIYNSNKIGYINTPLYHYRYYAASLSNNKETRVYGRIEESRNWNNIINYLKEKYGNIKLFEPELSNHINYFKDIYFFDKEMRFNKELFSLYPESHYFRKQLIISILKKIIHVCLIIIKRIFILSGIKK